MRSRDEIEAEREERAARSLAALEALPVHTMPGRSVRGLQRVPTWLRFRALKEREQPFGALLISAMRGGLWR
jgi:hypothetical protein